jgi:hypothetical protein
LKLLTVTGSVAVEDVGLAGDLGDGHARAVGLGYNRLPIDLSEKGGSLSTDVSSFFRVVRLCLG